MKIYSYVISRDFGFAPNPFGKYCTLATCKPYIREGASIGDWVVAKGGANLSTKGLLVFAMKVVQKLTYNEYWNTPMFQYKKPVLNGSLKQMYGDNIYYRTQTGNWSQANSHHSLADGSINEDNLKRDTKSNYVLISDQFYYFGKNAISLPKRFNGILHKGRVHKIIEEEKFCQSFIKWLSEKYEVGYHADPEQFSKIFQRYDGIN